MIHLYRKQFIVVKKKYIDQIKKDIGYVVKKDGEAPVIYRMNVTGNIYYSNTSGEINNDTKDLFNSCAVLFSAMTKAMRDKGKTLFDYEAWANMIGKSGFFVELQETSDDVVIKSNGVKINTQLVQSLLPSISPESSSMKIAKGVLNALGDEFKSDSLDQKTKLAHLLFICEEIMGAPTVVVKLYYASKETHTKMMSGSCGSTTSSEITTKQKSNTFMYIDPGKISKYAKDLNNENDEYNNLIKKLGDYVS